MKKRTALFLGIAAAFCFTACGSRPAVNTQDTAGDAAGLEKNDRMQNQNKKSQHQNAGSTALESDTDTQDGEQESTGSFPSSIPNVYMTEKITSESIGKLYEALEKKVTGTHTAVKISLEAMAGALKEGDDAKESAAFAVTPELIEKLILETDGTIVECSTIYNTSFLEPDAVYQTAEEFGFTDIADVDIMDADGSTAVPSEDGSHLAENYVGAHFPQYDGFFVFSHFKSHDRTGFDGAVRNISVGISSREGKCLIHTAGSSQKSLEIENQEEFLECMAEAGKSVVDALNGNVVFFNIVDRSSVGCDCKSERDEPDMHDIGILASADPVALDQACADLIYMEESGDDFVNCMETCNAEYVLEYGEEIGLGDCAYTVISVDR